jgi:DNA-directed RNA polymerase specialized sigma24 family protein
MAAPDDSSGSLPRVDDAGVPSHRDLLAGPEIRRSISTVARRRGVEGDAVDDVVQETLARALAQPLPADRAEARKYVHGIAKRVALDTVGEAASSGAEWVDDDAPDSGTAPLAVAAAQPATFDDRDEARKVISAGERRFPASFSYFLQARVLGRSAEQIANDHDVSAGHVRHQIVEMQRFVSDYRTRLAASIAVVLFAVAGWSTWRHDPTRSWALFTPRLRTEPPPLDPDALVDHLRERARRACNLGAFAACLADTEAADALDPIGARSSGGFRSEAMRGLMVYETSVDWDHQVWRDPKALPPRVPGGGGP